MTHSSMYLSGRRYSNARIILCNIKVGKTNLSCHFYISFCAEASACGTFRLTLTSLT